MLNTWTDILNNSFQQLWAGVISYIPNLVVAIVIFIVGWVIAVAIGKFIAQLISAVKVDKALSAAGVEEILAKGGFKLDSGAFLGGLVRWFLIIVFLIASLQALGLTQVNDFLRDVVLRYLPNVFASAFILIAAAFLSTAVQKVVTGSAKAAGMAAGGLAGGVTKWAIWGAAIVAVLFQLNIAVVFIQTLVTGFVAMLALAGGLAFGLGGKDAAARYLDKLKEDIKNNH